MPMQPHAGRAEGLRRAMLDYMNDNPRNAYPVGAVGRRGERGWAIAVQRNRCDAVMSESGHNRLLPHCNVYDCFHLSQQT
jgi:hypothetical protein